MSDKGYSPRDLVMTLYRLISGNRHTLRDWTAVRKLFWASARLRPIALEGDADARIHDLSLDQWFERATSRFATIDFYERGVILNEEISGHMAWISSPYESGHERDGRPFARGLNHFSFIHDGSRWLIAQIIWELETTERPLSSAADAALSLQEAG